MKGTWSTIILPSLHIDIFTDDEKTRGLQGVWCIFILNTPMGNNHTQAAILGRNTTHVTNGSSRRKGTVQRFFGYNTLLPAVSLSFSFFYDGPQRPPVPDCDVYLQQLMEQCWKTEPKVFIYINSFHIKLQFSVVNY